MGRNEHRGRVGSLPGALWEAIGEVATLQHGRICRRQLLAAGIGRMAVVRAIERGWLIPVHLGVYAVAGSPWTPEARWSAAVLAGGDRALLSDRSACELWGVARPIDGPVHVTTPRGGRSRAGIIFHRGSDLERHRSVHRLIPVTSVERSLLDYAAAATPWELRKAFEAADGRDLIEPCRLLELCGRGHAGSARLAALARSCVPGLITTSPLERDFVRFCRHRRLTVPLTNETVEGFFVDCYWPDHRLVVELDGYAFHRSREQFERDRRRDSALQLAGLRVFRVTADRLHRDADGLEAELRGAMAGG